MAPIRSENNPQQQQQQQSSIPPKPQQQQQETFHSPRRSSRISVVVDDDENSPPSSRHTPDSSCPLLEPPDLAAEATTTTMDVSFSSSSSFAWQPEALVHPLLLSHEHPRRVALIVDFSSSSHDHDPSRSDNAVPPQLQQQAAVVAATVQEILKHDTVDHCVILLVVAGTDDDDETRTSISQNNQNRTVSSLWLWLLLDDPRITLVFPPNATMVIDWFVQRYYYYSDNDDEDDDEDEELAEEDKFDVIILNSRLDLKKNFVDNHDNNDNDEYNNNNNNNYGNWYFCQALYHALTVHGILGGQLHPTVDVLDQPVYQDMMEHLEDVGFFSFREYTDAMATAAVVRSVPKTPPPQQQQPPPPQRRPRRRRRQQQLEEHYFFVAPKSRWALSQWFASAARIQLELARRGRRHRLRQIKDSSNNNNNNDDDRMTLAQPQQQRLPHDNQNNNSRESGPFFHYIDGATMALYHVPSRFVENIYCQNVAEYYYYHDHDSSFKKGGNNDELCQLFGLDPEKSNVPSSAFEVRPATNPKAGRGVFAKYDIPANVYMGVDEGVHAMLIMPPTWALIKLMAQENSNEYDHDEEEEERTGGASDYFEALYSYAEGYGMETFHYGEPAVIVDPGIFTFVNHGCFGLYQTSNRLPVTEHTADRVSAKSFLPQDFVWEFYSPHVQRRHWVDQGCTGSIEKAVPADAELLDNYLYLSQGVSQKEWHWWVQEMKSICQGTSAGLVSEYESPRHNNNMNKDYLS